MEYLFLHIYYQPLSEKAKFFLAQSILDKNPQTNDNNAVNSKTQAYQNYNRKKCKFIQKMTVLYLKNLPFRKWFKRNYNRTSTRKSQRVDKRKEFPKKCLTDI